MKLRDSIWCFSLIAILGIVSCKEKPAATGEKTEEKSIVESAVEKVAEAVIPGSQSLSDEERAAKVGFAQFLPKDTEVVFSVYDAKGASEQLKALKLYGIIERNTGMGMDDEIMEEMIEEDMLEDGDAEQDEEVEFEMEAQGSEPDPWMLLGQEVTLALGKSTGEQVGHLLTVNKRMAYFQALALGKAAQKFGETGDPNDLTDILEDAFGGEGFLQDIFEDPEGGVTLLEKMEMPPLYIAFRAKDGELDQAAQLLGGSMGLFGMAGEMVAPIEFESGGSTFMGYKVLGEEISKVLAAQRESLEERFKPETVSALIEMIAKKNFVAATGAIGDYAVFMFGGDESELKLTLDVKDSLVGTEELNFVDGFADKPVLAMMYGGKSGWEGIMDDSGGIGTYALGIRDGIAGGEGLGDTRDLQLLLQMIADREKELGVLGSSSDFGMVAFTDDGLKIESFGGYDKGSMDWSAQTTLAHLGDSEDNALFYNATGNTAYSEKASAYFEAILETLYASTIKLSELEIGGGDLLQAKQFAQLFDTKFRGDVVGLYEAMSSGLLEGLGSETAILIDLKGAMPAIPRVSQGLVDEARAPRITWLAPVKDRTQLTDSWKKMDAGITSLLSKVSEMVGEDIPMQKPISAEKDGMTTWFFSFPFFQDDFLPSVTVSDDWFAASSSKVQAVDLIGKAAAGGEAGNGMEFYANFNAITDYADLMLSAVENNKDAIFTNEHDLGNFDRHKAEYKEIIEAFREFESLTWTAKKENGYIRNSMHFKTK